MTVVLSVVLAVALLALARERRTRACHAELVARACHEVRGPMTAAHLALHALGRRGVPVAGVEGELRRAARALADLAAAPSGSRALDAPEAVCVAELLRCQTAGWQQLAEARGCSFELRAGGEAVVWGDRLRIAQACANLVANAVEHGAGRIEVRVRRVADRVAVEVADEGPGLPTTVAALAARPRAGRDARGRGLAIACDIAARHGGAVASAPTGAGGLVVLELPALDARGAAGVLPDDAP